MRPRPPGPVTVDRPKLLGGPAGHNSRIARPVRAPPRSLRLLALAAALQLAACKPSPSPTPAAWDRVASMVAPRAAHAVVATDDAIYALAGTGRGGAPVLDVERFDGERWAVETTLPGRGRNAPAAVVLDGRIFLIGGFDTTTNTPLDRVDVYDPITRTWSEATPLPAPRGGHAAAVMSGRIHVLGGGNSQSTLADHDVYDPDTRTWAALPALPRAEGSPAAVVHDGRLHAIGGRSGPADFGAVDIFDPRTNAWTAGPAIEPRGTAGAVVRCGAIHVLGGESQAQQRTLADVLRLDPSGGWQPLAPMPTARSFARAVLFRDAVHVVGGSLTPQTSHAPEGSAIVERMAPGCP